MDLGSGVIFWRLLISALLGGIVGAEREWRNQPAGLRTHLILSLGAALATVVSIELGSRAGSDPGRIAANIVTGIGFLGAGVIFRFGISVRGLTTAASIWTTAVIGMAVGAGMYWGAFVATGFLLLSLVILRRLESLFPSGRGSRNVHVSARSTPGIMKEVEAVFDGFGATVNTMDFRRDRSLDRIEVRAVLETPPNSRPVDLANALRELEEIIEVEVR
jgi:putative Mg2+ transporter-C (MgtC) family protein